MGCSSQSYQGKDTKGNTYYMQVCDEVHDLPPECMDQATAHGAVFKVTPSGTCILVGKHDPDASSELWAPLEDGKAADGVELHYLEGAPCSNMFGDTMGVTTDTGSALIIYLQLCFAVICHWARDTSCRRRCPHDLFAGAVPKPAHFRFRFFCKPEVENTDEYANYPVVAYARTYEWLCATHRVAFLHPRHSAGAGTGARCARGQVRAVSLEREVRCVGVAGAGTR